MTKKQAQRLMEDLEKNLIHDDYCEDLYVSIKNVGTKVFKNCAYYECEGYTFIWTHAEKFLLNKKEIGQYVLIPKNKDSVVKLNKVI